MTAEQKRPQGPQVKKLICHRMSVLMVPDGGGFGSAIAALNNKEKLIDIARQATERVFAAIDVVKTAPDCKWTTDEEIAAEINRMVAERQAKRPVI